MKAIRRSLYPSCALCLVALGAAQIAFAQSEEYSEPPEAQPGATNEVNSYLPSSSRPIVGEQEDTFDSISPNSASASTSESVTSGSGSVNLGARADGASEDDVDLAGTEYVDGDGSQFSGSKPAGAMAQKDLPEFHTVKKGDTLWGVSKHYFGNPWEWPRVWSNNPQVENPHWIYPGDQLRVAPSGEKVQDAYVGNDDNSASGGGFVGRDRMVPGGTVFMRDQGYIGDPEEDDWGELVGAHEDVMFLSFGNTVYLKMKDDVDLHLGQRLTIYKEVRKPRSVKGARKPDGEIVKVYGTVRIDDWNRDAKIARGKIIESLDTIERGARVGAVGRRFDVVPPKKADKQVLARILTSMYPTVFMAQHQVVFIDKGTEDGLSPGVRLRVFRRGDTWRRNLRYSSSHASAQLQLDSPNPPKHNEQTPLHGDDETFPDEIIGEVQILRSEQYSSVALVTRSEVELIPGDRLVATPGY